MRYSIAAFGFRGKRPALCLVAYLSDRGYNKWNAVKKVGQKSLWILLNVGYSIKRPQDARSN